MADYDVRKVTEMTESQLREAIAVGMFRGFCYIVMISALLGFAAGVLVYGWKAAMKV